MDTSEERNEKPTENTSLFPTAVSEEELDEARRKNVRKQFWISSQLFLKPGQGPPQRLESHGGLIIQRKAAEHYMKGTEAMGKFQYEKAVTYFSKAITLQPEETRLYVSRAEAYLQLCDFQSAAACYKQVQVLEPGAFSARLAFIYYLQGQCLFDQGLHQEALEAFSKAAALKPGCRAYEVRRVACLSAAGLHSDCLQLVDGWMLSDGHTPDLYVLRARLHKLLNKTSHCYRDVKSALALNPACPTARALLLQLQEAGEGRRRKAVERALSGQLPEALREINTALENCPQDGRLFLFRGTLYRRLKDFTAAIEDLVQAVQLGQEEDQEEEGDSVQQEAHFQMVLTYNDFAVQCFSRGLLSEATLLLNKAIEEEKGQAGLYLNRGDCFFKQGEWRFALADYQQAEEMMPPDEPAVRLRLSVLHNTTGSVCFQAGRFQEAADMFSLAVQHNPRTSRYYENRSKAFRKLLNLTRARQDFIRLLILDPTNEEVPPMLMHLFPGCSVSDVLSSSEGQAVRVQLMDTIQACSSRPHQPRLTEKLQKMSLAKENTTGQSEEASEAGQEVKLCVNQDQMQVMVKSLLKVLMGNP